MKHFFKIMLLALCLVATSCSSNSSDVVTTQKTASITRIERYLEGGTCTAILLSDGNIITFRNVKYAGKFFFLREGDEITYEIDSYGNLINLVDCKLHDAK